MGDAVLGLESWWERKWEMKKRSAPRACMGSGAEPLRGAREPSLSPGVPVHTCGRSLQTSGLLAASSLTEHSLPASGCVPPWGWGQEPRGGSRGVPRCAWPGQGLQLCGAWFPLPP